jgi:hypothetical protein
MPFPFPKGPKLHPLMHDLRDEHNKLKQPKCKLEEINKALLDPTIHVSLYSYSFERNWESEAWREFQEMTAEEKRPIIEQSMSQSMEKVSTMLAPSKVTAQCASSTARR